MKKAIAAVAVIVAGSIFAACGGGGGVSNAESHSLPYTEGKMYGGDLPSGSTKATCSADVLSDLGPTDTTEWLEGCAAGLK